MISVETKRPVYSNANGNLTPEEKKARRDKRIEKAKRLYQGAKETGTLTALENIAMRAGVPLAPPTDFNPDANQNQNQNNTARGWSSLTQGAKIGIIGGSVVIVGLAVWYFGFRKAK